MTPVFYDTKDVTTLYNIHVCHPTLRDVELHRDIVERLITHQFFLIPQHEQKKRLSHLHYCTVFH
jgi:hypothetical protein